MIVVAIIAILVAAAVPSFMSARDRAKRTAAKEGLSQLRKAMELYMTRSPSSEYPLELSGSGKSEADVVGSLGSYTRITGTFHDFLNERADFEVIGSRFTLSIRSKDRLRTPITATEGSLLCQTSGGAC